MEYINIKLDIYVAQMLEDYLDARLDAQELKVFRDWLSAAIDEHKPDRTRWGQAVGKDRKTQLAKS